MNASLPEEAVFLHFHDCIGEEACCRAESQDELIEVCDSSPERLQHELMEGNEATHSGLESQACVADSDAAPPNQAVPLGQAVVDEAIAEVPQEDLEMKSMVDPEPLEQTASTHECVEPEMPPAPALQPLVDVDGSPLTELHPPLQQRLGADGPLPELPSAPQVDEDGKVQINRKRKVDARFVKLPDPEQDLSAKASASNANDGILRKSDQLALRYQDADAEPAPKKQKKSQAAKKQRKKQSKKAEPESVKTEPQRKTKDESGEPQERDQPKKSKKAERLLSEEEIAVYRGNLGMVHHILL